MEENEISLENIANEAENAESTAESAENTQSTEAEESGGTEAEEPEADDNTEADAESAEAEAISAEVFAKTLANPMFAVFARGRSGSIEEAILDFEKMIAAGRSTLSEEELMKMTPGAYSAASGTVLSERQRRIARDAGMSYREYYEIIRSIPTKTK